MKEIEPAESKPRTPPKFMGFIIWSTAGDDAQTAFEDRFARGVKKFGYWPTLAWAVWQCLRAVPYAIWGAVLTYLGLW